MPKIRRTHSRFLPKPATKKKEYRRHFFHFLSIFEPAEPPEKTSRRCPITQLDFPDERNVPAARQMARPDRPAGPDPLQPSILGAHPVVPPDGPARRQRLRMPNRDAKPARLRRIQRPPPVVHEPERPHIPVDERRTILNRPHPPHDPPSPRSNSQDLFLINVADNKRIVND